MSLPPAITQALREDLVDGQHKYEMDITLALNRGAGIEDYQHRILTIRARNTRRARKLARLVGAFLFPEYQVTTVKMRRET